MLALMVNCVPAVADDENPDLEKEVQVNVDEISLRDPLEIEQAVMEYMLAFEAYQSARKSKDPETRGKMVQYMKQYREAYARFLNMMREDKLYEPQKPKNPAGRYNRKHQKDKGNKREWSSTAGKETRDKIRKMVESGASPEEIKKAIRVSLPKAPMSFDPTLNTCGPDSGSGGSNTTTTLTRPTIPPKTDGKDGDKDDGPDGDKDRIDHHHRHH